MLSETNTPHFRSYAGVHEKEASLISTMFTFVRVAAIPLFNIYDGWFFN